MSPAKLRRSLVLCVFLLAPLAAAGASSGGPACTDLNAQAQTVGRFLGRAFDKILVTDPAKQLRPGDVLVYPFHDEHEHGGPPGDGEKPEEGPPFTEPEAYKAALKGYGHAAIVARDAKGKLFHLDSPHSPADDEWSYDFGGSRPFYVVRPKTPEGMTQGEFEKKVNAAANCIKRIGFDYDPMMKMDYLDAKKLDEMKKVVDRCPDERAPGQPSPFPPQSCAELTQSVLAIAGAKTARPSQAGHLLDLALDHVKKSGPDGRPLTGKALDKAVEQAVDDLIRMYTFGVESGLKSMTRAKDEMEKDLADQKSKGVANLELERAIRDITGEMTNLRRELATYALAKAMLRTVAAKRLRGEKVDLPVLGNVLDQPIVRPYDILAEGVEGRGGFQLTRFYPGHIPACPRTEPSLPPPDDLPPHAPPVAERSH